MKKYKMSEAIGNISACYIEEAAEFKTAEKPRSKSVNTVKWLSLAACFFLMVTVIFAAVNSGLLDMNGGTDGGMDQGTSDGGNSNSPEGSMPEAENPRFDIANGALHLEIYDSYIIEGEADVITVYLTDCKGQSEIYFRPSKKIKDQNIRRITTADGRQSATESDGIFTFEFTAGQDFVFLNLYFDEGTFARGVKPDMGSADISTDDEKNTVIYFECSAISPEEGYDEIVFDCPLSSISDEAKLSISGTALTLEQALNAVDFKQLFIFDGYDPSGIMYFNSSKMCEIAYSYGINANVRVRATEYHGESCTLDNFVNSVGYFDPYLYLFTTDGVTEHGYAYKVYSCFKNESDFKSEIVVLEYNASGCDVFFYIQFDLYGENAKYDVKSLIGQMKLVDIGDLKNL